MEPCYPTLRWLIRGLVVCTALALAWFAVGAARAQDPTPPAALRKVPPDAAAFVHLKVRDLWKAEATAALREMLGKAGTPALDAFNKRFTPALATVESIAVYVLTEENGQPAVGVVVACNEAFDPAKVLKAMLPKGATLDHFGQKYMADKEHDLAAKVIDNKTLLVSNCKDITTLLGHEAKDSGPMTGHFAAAGGHVVYAVFDSELVPRSTKDALPEDVQAATRAKQLIVTGQFRKEVDFKFRLRFADDTAATVAEKSVRAGMALARARLKDAITTAEKKATQPAEGRGAGLADLPDAISGLFALAAARSLDGYLANPPLVRQGDSLILDLHFDPNSPQTIALASAFGYGVLAPSVASTKATSTLATSQANLKAIGQAMHSHLTDHGKFPTQAIWSKDNKKQLLSWRVALLPYLGKGQLELYKEFKLDQPWDSEHNKKLIAKIPAVYQDLDAPTAKEPGLTHYQVFVGGGAGFRTDFYGIRPQDVTDGLAQTVMVVTANDPVIWTKPVDLPYSGQKAIPKLGLNNKAANVLFFDGTVRTLGGNVTAVKLRALITAANGELIGDDF